MIMRLLGMALTLGIIGYMFYSFNHSKNSVDDAINKNAVVQSNKAALEGVGVNTSKEELEKYTIEQAKQINSFQQQLDENQ